VVHNTALNSSDNLSDPSDNHHSFTAQIMSIGVEVGSRKTKCTTSHQQLLTQQNLMHIRWSYCVVKIYRLHKWQKYGTEWQTSLWLC